MRFRIVGRVLEERERVWDSGFRVFKLGFFLESFFLVKYRVGSCIFYR